MSTETRDALREALVAVYGTNFIQAGYNADRILAHPAMVAALRATDVPVAEGLRETLHKAVDAPFKHPLNDNVRRSRIHAAIDSALATPEPDA